MPAAKSTGSLSRRKTKMKKCPYCAEEIQDDARKCRFCNADLAPKKKWLGCLWGCLIFILISVVSVAILVYLAFFMLKVFAHKVLGDSSSIMHLPFGQMEHMMQQLVEFLRHFLERIQGISPGPGRVV
jgi:hypothetical protein